MSVFTHVSKIEAEGWLTHYDIGELAALEGIAAGIENTNYFLDTTRGRFVLTLFEKIGFDEIVWYMALKAHLARKGLAVPAPVQRKDHAFVGWLNNRPTAMITRIAGAPILAPTPAHCRTMGAWLARMHEAGRDFTLHLDNPRGQAWRERYFETLKPYLADDEIALIGEELALHARADFSALPTSAIHGDLFRDNALWEGERLSGVIDFYFGCQDHTLYDLAVTVNDWCTTRDDWLDASRYTAMLEGYASGRALGAAERAAWPMMLRVAALRSWLGRLGYLHLPMDAELTNNKDTHYHRHLIEHYRADPPLLPA